MNSVWKVAFKGEMLAGFELQQVKQELAQLLKLNEEQIGRLFCGKEMILKKQQPLEKAEKYKQYFEQRGMKVYLVEEPKPFDRGIRSLSLEPVEEKSKPETQVENTALSTQTTGLSFIQNELHNQKTDSGKQSEQQSDARNRQTDDGHFDDAYYHSTNSEQIQWVSDRDTYVDAPDIFSLSFEGRYGRLNYANAGWVAKVILVVGSLISIKHPLLLVILIPIFLVFSFRITALRLHDLNFPAWYSVPGLLFPVILALAGVDVLATLLYVIFELLLLIYPGSEGSNNYGPRSEQGSAFGLVLICLAVPRLIIGFLGSVS